MLRPGLIAIVAAGLLGFLPHPGRCSEPVDQAEGAKTVELLKQLIKFDTSNAPGDTTQLAQFLQVQFAAVGADTTIITAPNGKAAHFIARLKGDSSKQPVLLAAHADVVPAESVGWTVDPFAGVSKDGFIYGRGAMDFKGGLAVFARAVMRLAEEKKPLARDVIFLAEADEEQGPYNGSWLAKDHWDQMSAEFVLNEGGYIFHNADGVVRQVNVTTQDKTTVSVRLRTVGASGHPSRPPPVSDTAAGRMVNALARLSGHDPRVRLVPQVRAYLEVLAAGSPGVFAEKVKEFLARADDKSQRQSEQAMLAARSSSAPLLHALLRDTLAITKVNAGATANVVPGEAEALLDVRLLPGSTVENVFAEINDVISDPNVVVEIRTSATQEAAKAYLDMRTGLPASSVETDLYKAIERNARRVWPSAAVTAALFEAGTDAIAWRQRAVPVYGVYPYPLDDSVLRGMHGADERISIQSLYEGTEWIYRVLSDVAVKDQPAAAK